MNEASINPAILLLKNERDQKTIERIRSLPNSREYLSRGIQEARLIINRSADSTLDRDAFFEIANTGLPLHGVLKKNFKFETVRDSRISAYDDTKGVYVSKWVMRGGLTEIPKSDIEQAIEEISHLLSSQP